MGRLTPAQARKRRGNRTHAAPPGAATAPARLVIQRVSVIAVGWSEWATASAPRLPHITFAAHDWNATVAQQPDGQWQIAQMQTVDAQNRLVTYDGIFVGGAWLTRVGGRPVNWDAALNAIVSDLYELGRAGADARWRTHTFEIQIQTGGA